MADTADRVDYAAGATEDLFLRLGDMLPFRPEGWRAAADRRLPESDRGEAPEPFAEPERLAA